MRNLVLSSIFLLLLGGCSFPLLSGYRHGDCRSEMVPGSWFGSDSGHYLLNTRIDLRGRHFTGLLIIKPQGTDHYRAVFIAEVGFKIFDMEFTPGQKVRIHYVMDALNKRTFINKLVHDLRLILMTGSVGDIAMLHDRDTGDPVIKIADHGRRNYYHYQAALGRASVAMQTGCILKKARATFYGTHVTGIDSIKISHYHVKLRIQMFRIKEDTGHAVE